MACRHGHALEMDSVRLFNNGFQGDIQRHFVAHCGGVHAGIEFAALDDAGGTGTDGVFLQHWVWATEERVHGKGYRLGNALDGQVTLDADGLVAPEVDLGGFEGGRGVGGGVQEVRALDVLVELVKAGVDGSHVYRDVDLGLLGFLVQYDGTGGLVEAQYLFGHSHVIVRKTRERVGGVQHIGLRRGEGLASKQGGKSEGNGSGISTYHDGGVLVRV